MTMTFLTMQTKSQRPFSPIKASPSLKCARYPVMSHDALMWGIFRRLGANQGARPPLQKLTIRASVSGEELMAENSGFSSFYKSIPKGKKKLELLKLAYTTVNGSLCKFLLDTHYGRAKRIELTNSEFNLEACRRFGSFMQLPPTTTKRNKRKNGVDVSILFDFEERDINTSPLPGAFLLPSTGRIRLRALEIEMNVTNHAPLLAYRLPQLQYMNKLRACFSPDVPRRPGPPSIFEGVPSEFDHDDPVLHRQQMLKGIRRNGSLHYLEIQVKDFGRGWRPFFSPADESKVEAYLERNRQLPVLLSKPRLVDNQASTDQGSADQESADQESADQESANQESADQESANQESTNQASTNQASTDQSLTDLELFPCLFCSASEADSMAPTNVLIGLMATSN